MAVQPSCTLVRWIRLGDRRKLATVTQSLSLLRTHRLPLLLWVAPAIVFRAMMPVGFMLEPIAGRAAIVLCGSNAPNAVHDRGSDDHAGHHRHSHADLTCPYAQSVAPAPLATLVALAAAPMALVLVLSAQVQQTHAHFGPTREHSARAPPRLA